jgi:hypothetical protein
MISRLGALRAMVTRTLGGQFAFGPWLLFEKSLAGVAGTAAVSREILQLSRVKIDQP